MDRSESGPHRVTDEPATNLDTILDFDHQSVAVFLTAREEAVRRDRIVLSQSSGTVWHGTWSKTLVSEPSLGRRAGQRCCDRSVRHQRAWRLRGHCARRDVHAPQRGHARRRRGRGARSTSAPRPTTGATLAANRRQDADHRIGRLPDERRQPRHHRRPGRGAFEAVLHLNRVRSNRLLVAAPPGRADCADAVREIAAHSVCLT